MDLAALIGNYCKILHNCSVQFKTAIIIRAVWWFYDILVVLRHIGLFFCGKTFTSIIIWRVDFQGGCKI